MDIFSFDEFEDLPKKEEAENTVQEEVKEETQQIELPAVYAESEPTNALIKTSMDVGINLSEQDMAELKNFMASSKYGHQSSLSMKCTGIKCDFYEICPLKKINAELPVGKQCQPPGTKVLVVDKSIKLRDQTKFIQVSIENLDPSLHSIVSYSRKKSRRGGGTNTLRTRGREFSLHSREYVGELVKITAGNYSHKCTKDHISIVKWNEKAINKFVVYLMKKENKFRIGTTKLIWESESGKLHSGLAARCRAESADSMWILGVYDTNTEALLNEEFFSLQAQIPKALFIATDNKSTKKHNGLYRWVDQKQLDDHHDKCALPEYKYSEFLSKLGLSIENPFYRFKSGQMIGGITSSFEIAACNIIPDLMQVSIFESPFNHKTKGVWTDVKIERELYSGLVYSLDVEKDNTYISNNIATHNCPVENALIEQWVSMYFASLGIDKEDPGNSIEVHMVYELAGLELLRRRAANELSRNSSLVKNMVVGYSPQGEPIYDDKPSQALLILERHSKIVNKLRESLLATPKSAAQAGQISSDVSTRTANILKKTRAIMAARKSGNSIEDVNFQVIDQEDKENENKPTK